MKARKLTDKERAHVFKVRGALNARDWCWAMTCLFPLLDGQDRARLLQWLGQPVVSASDGSPLRGRIGRKGPQRVEL